MHVTIDDGNPASLTIHGHAIQVTDIRDTWIIEDEWWRQPIQRQYYAVLLEDGTRRTIFHDRIADTWYVQEY